ncbi:MAG: hypothetical protein IKW80_02495, partial [Thermoguttaceae bacterium]|nr:hypothetical protein [Thermoguttaceae bacterium]
RGAGGRNADNTHSNKDNLNISSDEIVVDIYGVISLFNAPSKDMFPGLADKNKGASDDSENDSEEDETEGEETADAEGNDDSEQ